MKTMKISLLLLLLPFLGIAQADLVLTVGSEIQQTTVDRGELLRLTLRVENRGNQSAIATYANIYLSIDESIGMNNIPRTFGIGDLAPNEYVEVPILYNIDKKTTPGSYYVLVDLDATKLVYELDESNLYKMPDFVTVLSSEVSYTKLPYPIVLVHGWEGNKDTWADLKTFYEDAYGLIYGGELPFCLNISENSTKYWEDISYFPQALGSGDFYIVNFDVGRRGELNASDNGFNNDNVLSNQAAIYKQGIGVKWAIEEVLKVSGADDVILIGHSMGGLASRQYLQNPENWQSDGHHHVAKLLTVATPNGGSNLDVGILGDIIDLFWDKNQGSESVRDMRYKSDDFAGVFLDGGYEFFTENEYLNLDINCNGVVSDEIIGLNQKYAPTDLEYSSVIGIGVDSDPQWNPFIDSDGDGIVEAAKSDLNTFIKFRNQPNDLIVESFYATPISEALTFGTLFHSNLAGKKRYFNHLIRGQDETEFFRTAIPLEKGFLYQGVISKQSFRSAFGTDTDIDSYYFTVEKESDVTIHLLNIPVKGIAIQLYNANYDLIGEQFEYGHSVIEESFRLTNGEYFVDVTGFQEDEDSKWMIPYYIAITAEEIEETPLQVFIDDNFVGDCEAYSYQFNGSSIGDVTSWSWRFEDGKPATSTDKNPKVTFDAPGTYEVELEISNANQVAIVSQSIIVEDRSAKIKDVIITNDNCGFKNGAISILMEGGNSAHDFVWSNGSQSAHQTNLGRGIYEVTINNSFGCEVVETINLEGASEFKLNVSRQTISCWGESDGSINIAPEGGTAPYEVTVRDPQNKIIEEWSNLSNGGYTILVKDAKGCPVNTGVYLVNPPKIEVEISYRERNGQTEAVADVSGGTRPYEVFWSNGDIGNFTSKQLSADASVKVIDGAGCEAIFPVAELSTGVTDLVFTYFNLFPNPITDQLNIELVLPTPQILDFKIYTATGQEVRSWKDRGKDFKRAVVLDNLPVGKYLLYIKGKNGYLSSIFLKIAQKRE